MPADLNKSLPARCISGERLAVPQWALQNSSQSDGALQMVALRKAPSAGAAFRKGAAENGDEAKKCEVSILIEAGQGEGMAGEGQQLDSKSPEAKRSRSDLVR